MNMMKYCPECYKEIPPESPSCPFCGYKTGNGLENEDGIAQLLKTPETDSYLPPEQTILSLLLLLIFFWGINIAITVLPIYLNAGTIKNILIAGISSQVLTRGLIGFWAFEEISLKKDIKVNQKIVSFLLTFIPLGAIFSFLHASRTMIRKDRLSTLSISSIAAVIIMTILLFGTSEGISKLTAGEELPLIPLRASLGRIRPTEFSNSSSSETSSETSGSNQIYCRDPASVTIDEQGEILDVCGKVTNFGDIDCPACPSGFYSFIKLDDSFQIVSYDWHFSISWLEKCLLISDKIEILGDIPVFVFSKDKGTECYTDNQGELVCDGVNYFQEYQGCK